VIVQGCGVALSWRDTSAGPAVEDPCVLQGLPVQNTGLRSSRPLGAQSKLRNSGE
jgi:hypothetical protein